MHRTAMMNLHCALRQAKHVHLQGWGRGYLVPRTPHSSRVSASIATHMLSLLLLPQ